MLSYTSVPSACNALSETSFSACPPRPPPFLSRECLCLIKTVPMSPELWDLPWPCRQNFPNFNSLVVLCLLFNYPLDRYVEIILCVCVPHWTVSSLIVKWLIHLCTPIAWHHKCLNKSIKNNKHILMGQFFSVIVTLEVWISSIFAPSPTASCYT